MTDVQDRPALMTRQIPAPAVTIESKPFWDAAAEGKFLIKHCNACGEDHWYPRALCPFCEFSLVGLMPSQGRVRCPECGEVVVLAEHRIHEDDLIPDTPEGRKAMQAKWRQFGADRYGSLSGGKPEQAGPKGPQREKWMDLKRPR